MYGEKSWGAFFETDLLFTPSSLKHHWKLKRPKSTHAFLKASFVQIMTIQYLHFGKNSNVTKKKTSCVQESLFHPLHSTAIVDFLCAVKTEKSYILSNSHYLVSTGARRLFLKIFSAYFKIFFFFFCQTLLSKMCKFKWSLPYLNRSLNYSWGSEVVQLT